MRLFAPESYGQQPCCFHDATDEQKAEAIGKGGCGPGGFGDWLVPDRIWGLLIRPSCGIHDWMYRYGIDLNDKKLSDRVFINNTVRQIEGGLTWPWLRRRRRKAAWIYYTFVKRYGAPSFFRGKNQPQEMQEVMG